jgi:hypothetical protein
MVPSLWGCLSNTYRCGKYSNQCSCSMEYKTFTSGGSLKTENIQQRRHMKVSFGDQSSLNHMKEFERVEHLLSVVTLLGW